MMKYFRNAGYIQVYVGSGFFFGFILTAYGNWLFTFSVLGFLTLAVIFFIIKSLTAETRSNPELDVKKALAIISSFYGVLLGAFVLAVIVGLLVGL